MRGRRHRVTTTVDGAAHGCCRVLEDGAKEGSVGSCRLNVATKPGDKKWRSSLELGGTVTVPVASRICAPASGVEAAWRPGGHGPAGRPAAAPGRTAATDAAAVAGVGLAAAGGPGAKTAATAGAGEWSAAAAGRAVQGSRSALQVKDLPG